MKIPYLPAIVLLVLPSFAVEVVFPNKDNSYDLASETAWGEQVLADSDKTTITTVKGTYHASKDVDLKGIFFRNDTKYSTNIIDQTSFPDVVITATNGIAINNGGRVYSYGELKGGIYNLCGTGNLAAGLGWNNGRSNTLAITGATITNIHTLYISHRTEANVMKISDAAKIFTKNFNPFHTDLNKDATLEVSGESKIVIYNSSNIGIANGEKNLRNKILLSGEGTLVSNTTASAYVIGGKECQETLISIKDGAKFYLNGGAYLFNSAECKNNRVEVDAGELISSSTIYFPREVSSCSNEISIINGGVFETQANNLELKGTNNSINVRNATFKINNSFLLGNSPASHKCRFSIAGEQSSYQVSTINYLFDSGNGHTFEITDNAKIESPNSLYLFNTAQTNSLLITNGGIFSPENILVRSYYPSNTNNCNTIFIGNDSKIETSSLAVFCSDNNTIVSNGTLNCTSSIQLGAKISETSIQPIKNNSLILQGATPCVSTYMFYANNSSKIVFDLSSDEKYNESVPLITAALLSSDGTMGIEINNVENCLKNLSETTIIKLIETGNSLPNNLEQQITLINGKLPDTCRLYLSKDGKSLLLRLKPIKGFKVIIR